MQKISIEKFLFTNGFFFTFNTNCVNSIKIFTKQTLFPFSKKPLLVFFIYSDEQTMMKICEKIFYNITKKKKKCNNIF